MGTLDLKATKTPVVRGILPLIMTGPRNAIQVFQIAPIQVNWTQPSPSAIIVQPYDTETLQPSPAMSTASSSPFVDLTSFETDKYTTWMVQSNVTIGGTPYSASRIYVDKQADVISLLSGTSVYYFFVADVSFDVLPWHPYFMINPMLEVGDTVYADTPYSPAVSPVALPRESNGQVLKLVSGAPAWATP